MRRALLASLLLCSACPRPAMPPLDLKPHVEPELVGVRHTVKAGESLWRIARAYDVDPSELALANHVEDPARLAVGQELFIPGAKAKVEVPQEVGEPAPAPSPGPEVKARLGWPLVGVLYAKFGMRKDGRHDGIDIAAPLGTPVLAGAAGIVIYAGEQRGYGHVVIVQHSDSLITLYAHNSAVLVKDGDEVKSGQPVARVGEASRTSGPHLHFEVREGKVAKDPLKFLPPPR